MKVRWLLLALTSRHCAATPCHAHVCSPCTRRSSHSIHTSPNLCPHLCNAAQVTGTQIHRSATFFMGGKFKSVKFKELELHRIIGTGQFGLVRLVRHVVDNEVYALKVGGAFGVSGIEGLVEVRGKAKGRRLFLVRLCSMWWTVRCMHSWCVLQQQMSQGAGEGEGSGDA